MQIELRCYLCLVDNSLLIHSIKLRLFDIEFSHIKTKHCRSKFLTLPDFFYLIASQKLKNISDF